ncbi:hypothetical protein KOI35_23180 [Actinoplanes bogorensis]|uniref:FHA domain-containing protein n=1 Tax=Paractinoplanes bogorensis TaxID=1610840 RepID=A0ABS5YSH4_9ACTN|nr:hypothetical protein [Actinoplanes bogorensis]MBU2666412.1 hypothetical protein [Actinoplanes bogorensis]
MKQGVMYAHIHTPCGPGDSPLPADCPFDGHKEPDGVELYELKCRVRKVPRGGHLWFGAVRPAEIAADDWLQVGDHEPGPQSAVSRVAGRIWFTSPEQGSRVLVENLSHNNTLELRSDRLPQPVTLFPIAAAMTTDPHSELLGSPMAAVQTQSTTVVIANGSTRFVVWIEVPIRRESPITPPWTHDPRAAGSTAEQAELDDAALRIQLAAPENYQLLADFTDSERVKNRLRNSARLRAFVERRPGEIWQDFVKRELRNVREGRPTHEIHRLILESIGTPPEHDSKWYTNLVAHHLAPEREVRGSRGGAGGGMNDLIPKVKGYWAFRRFQLEDYLLRDRGLDRGIGRDLDD